jgi:hypothetical protein
MDNKKKSSGKPETDAGARAQKAKKAKPKATRYCGVNQTNKLVRELRQVGLQLRSTAGDTQLETLPKVLEYLGPRGINTYEAVAAGYLRIATRIKDLEDEWEIHSLRENVVGPDGLFHKGVARYVMGGRRQDPAQSQPGQGV